MLLRRAAVELPAIALSETDMTTAERAAYAALKTAVSAVAQPAATSAGTVRRLAAGSSGLGIPSEIMSGSLLDLARTMGEGAPQDGTPVSVEHSSKQGSAETSVKLGSQTAADGTRTSQIDARQTVNDGANTMNSRSTAKATGKVCPDAAGQVIIHFEISDSYSGSAGGRSASGSRQIKGTATAQVNDAADMESLDFAMDMNTSGQHADGSAYGMGMSSQFGFGGAGIGSAPGGAITSQPASSQWTGRTAGTTEADTSRESSSATLQFSLTAFQYMLGLQRNWRSGHCVHIEAADPGSVLTGSSTVIHVAVKHVVEGGEVHLPVSVSLSGEKSVTPSRIGSSPGPVTYVAPDQAGGTATLTFKTVSRRGMDTKTMSLRTRDRIYRISGGGDGLVVDDSAGPLDKPFTFTGTFPGGEVEFSCTPSSNRSGAVTGQLSGSGATGTVSGSYSIVGPDEGPLTMTQTTYGCVDNVPGSCRTVTSVFTLTP